MGTQTNADGWSANTRRGVLVQDSCSLSAGIEHGHVSNRLTGDNETHRLGNLSNKFHLMAQQVRDVSREENEEDAIDKVSGLHLQVNVSTIKFSHTIHALSLRTQYFMSYA